MKNPVFFILLAACLAIPQCSSKRRPYSASKELVLATGIPIGEIAPFSSKEGIGSNLVDLLYRPLFRLSSEGKIIPDFAKAVSWNESEHTLAVEVAAGDAKDVKKSIETAKSMAGGGYSEGLASLQQIDVLSDNRLTFRLSRFDRAFLSIMGHLPIVLYSQQDNTTGDFLIVAQTPDEVVFHRKQPSPSLVNVIKAEVIPTPRRAMRDLVAGNIDVLISANKGDFEILKDVPGLKFGELPTNILYFVLENRNGGSQDFIPWAKVSELIDRPQFIQSLKQWSLTPAVDSNPFGKASVNPQAAETLGAKRNSTLSFLGGQDRDLLIARLLKRRLDELGIDLSLEPYEPKVFGEEVIFKKKFDLALLELNIKDPIVTNFLVFHSPTGPNSLNYSAYSNPSLDQYLEEARYNSDDRKASEFFAKAMEEIRRDPPGLFLFWLKMPLVYRDSCSGFNFSSDQFFPSLKDVRCEPSAAN